MINGIEIFSGAGGLATGLGIAGIHHTAFVEWNNDACRTLRKNYEPSIVNHCDIRSFDFTKFSEIDFIAGGPPCQPFSLGGLAKGVDDERDMFPQAIRSIRELCPRAFVFENVKGLLRESFRDYLTYILEQLRYPEITYTGDNWREHYRHIEQHKNHYTGLEYNVNLTLVNAADYGIPQKRERIIIVGIRKDLNIEWDFPIKTHSSDALNWSKYVTGEYWERHNILPTNAEYVEFSKYKYALELKYGMFPPTEKPWQTVRDALLNMPEHKSDSYYPHEHIIREGAREYPGHTGSLIDEPSKTIKAGGHGVPGGENMIKFQDGSVRYYTIFETKRIQTFPDDYEIVGSWGEAMRQIGNAVPVELARIIGESIVRKVFSNTYIHNLY